MELQTVDTALGRFVIGVTDAGVARIGLPGGGAEPASSAHPVARAAAVQLAEYVGGERRRFDLPLDLSGLTPFRQKVLDACARIPFGETATYGELAAAVGSPGAARAVGGAMATNPVAVVVPCHRVLRAGGGLGGYAGGLVMKERLLRLEAG